MSVTKLDAEDNTPIAGAVFGLYADEDIKNVDGKVIIEKGTLLEKTTSDENGKIAFVKDYPFAKYVARELVKPAGYVTNEEAVNFDTKYQGQDVKTAVYNSEYKNTPTTFEFTKTDITSGAELTGATLTVLDKDGNVVDTWTSDVKEAHVIKRLVVGETYTLREEFAPYGYLKAKDVFGNYIHKYYYNQSIADGYTLKLIREEIETTYKNQLNATLDQIVRQGSIAKKNLYAHPKFVEKMVDYIIQDFEEGRTALDSSIGAMIVCDSSEQAREVDRQLKRFSAYTHALVLHDEGTKQDRKNDQEEFKKGNIDILVVYNMLLTGFDAPRLKKQYLARMIKAHNLLQTLTRVNRPYKGYHYGYVVDFANIKDEFDKTNKAYFDELQSELGDEVQNYSNIFKSKEDIEKDLKDVKNQLFLYDTSNVVSFINQISEIDDKKQLLNLRQALENYKAMYNLIRLYGYEDLYTHFNVENAIKCLNEVNNRISIINLKNSIDSSEDMSQILNMALDQIDFQFRKIKEEELIIADAFRDTLEKTRREIVDRCLDPKDPEYISLLDELKRVFKKKNIEELTADEMKQMMGNLNALKKKAEKRNLADRMLAAKYSGDVKYMRTHKRIMNSPPPITDAVTIHRILMTVKSKADDQIAHNENILDNEEYFIKSLQPIILRACMGEKVKLDKPQLMFIDNCLSKEYILERDWVS